MGEGRLCSRRNKAENQDGGGRCGLYLHTGLILFLKGGGKKKTKEEEEKNSDFDHSSKHNFMTRHDSSSPKCLVWKELKPIKNVF